MPKSPLPSPAALVLLTLAACSGTPSGAPGEPPLAPVILTTLVEGDGQAGVGGTRLPRPLQVRATRDGSPVPSLPISWSTTSGSLSLNGSFTDGLGIATVHWTLGDDDGEGLTTAAIYDAPDQRVEFRATIWPRVDVRRVAGSQIGEVGTVLGTPMRVRVTRHGKPATDIPVTWDAVAGTVEPAASVTDHDGYATTTWTLGPSAGKQRLLARVRGHPAGAVELDVVAAHGPPASIDLVGAYQPRPANFRFADDVVEVAVTDRFGNPVTLEWLQWQVVSGPGIIDLTAPPSNDDGVFTAYLRPLGTPGTVVVRVTAGGGAVVAEDFAFTFSNPVFEVHLSGGGFRSPMNGSTPAVDTIPVGATLRWVHRPFDYETHGVESVGSPSFIGGGEFGYGTGAWLSATFTAAGTYQYRDPYSGATGTVVVQ